MLAPSPPTPSRPSLMSTFDSRALRTLGDLILPCSALAFRPVLPFPPTGVSSASPFTCHLLYPLPLKVSYNPFPLHGSSVPCRLLSSAAAVTATSFPRPLPLTPVFQSFLQITRLNAPHSSREICDMSEFLNVLSFITFL